MLWMEGTEVLFPHDQAVRSRHEKGNQWQGNIRSTKDISRNTQTFLHPPHPQHLLSSFPITSPSSLPGFNSHRKWCQSQLLTRHIWPLSSITPPVWCWSHLRRYQPQLYPGILGGEWANLGVSQTCVHMVALPVTSCFTYSSDLII